MATTMFSKILNFRSRKTRHKYTQMETEDDRPATVRSSFDEALNRIGASRLDQWPQFPFEEQYKSHQDEQHPSAELSTRSRFFPTRCPVLRSSGFLNRITRMSTKFPIQDISWIVAFSFTIGSAVFVVNGFFLLLPIIDPATDFTTETPYATPASSVLGTLIFLIGGYAGFLEGLNLQRRENTNVTEGMDIEAIEIAEVRMKMDDEHTSQETEPKSGTSSHQGDSDDTVEVPSIRASTSTLQTNEDTNAVQTTSQPPLLSDTAFIYLPTGQQILTIYKYSLVFHASLIQFIGTIIFSMATITSLPGILPSSTSSLLIPLLNLLPASLGGLLFLIAAILQILNAQTKWWIPRPWKGDWQVGFWNAMGSVGFTLAGSLPVLGTETASYVGTLADFWGSWAFLVGSLCQWFIVMGYYP
jgi:hypothetical protein